METVRVERDSELPGLVTITLSRPDKLNAINATMHRELQEVCAALKDDPAARVVILTGEGRAFSAGADLGQRREPGAPPPPPPPDRPVLEQRNLFSAGNRTCAALDSLEQVTIGVVNGLAIGGAVVFLSCMDIRLAAESAWFSIPEVDLGIPLTWNALPRLMRELGPARTRELVMTCDRFTANDAHRWGFVNHVYPDADLVPRARELAAKLLAKDPLSLALTKSATAALAEAMVPTHVTYTDRELLMLSNALRDRP